MVRGLANSSGTTHIVVPLAEEQAAMGHAVSVYHVAKGSEPPVLPDAGSVDSRCFPETVPTTHAGVSLQAFRALSRQVRGFDVVHVHAVWNLPSAAAMRAALRAGVPCMVAPQGSIEPWAYRQGHWLRRLYARRVEIPLIDRVARLQALTDTEQAQFRAFGLRPPAVVVPNGVSIEWLRDDEPGRVPGQAGTVRMLFLSRLHPKKNVETLLRAFAAQLGGVDAELVIAGDDAGSGHGASLRRLAGALGLTGRCRFVGEVRGEDKRRLLREADLYVLPSHSEGLPVAVLEAMACARPVLVTPGCNLPGVCSEQAGWIVDADVDGVRRGLAEALAARDEWPERGRRGRALVERTFTWPRIARRLVTTYETMIAEKQDT